MLPCNNEKSLFPSQLSAEEMAANILGINKCIDNIFKKNAALIQPMVFSIGIPHQKKKKKSHFAAVTQL